MTINDRLVLTEAPRMHRTTAHRDFDGFYRSEADPLARALALTLGDADLAREAVDEGMARAYQRWHRIGRYENPGGWVLSLIHI